MKDQKSPLLADIIARTEEGGAALVRAVAVAHSNPARVAFLATATANVVAELAGAKKVSQYTSTAVMPLLILSEPLTVGYALSGFTAAVGQWEKAARPDNPSTCGVLCVSAQHVDYIARLDPQRARVAPLVGAAYAGVWSAGSLLAATRSRAHLPAVALGGAVVTAMAAMAQNPRLRAHPSTQGVSHGANLVLASEGITFAKNLLPRKATLLRRAAGAAEAGLFAVGHLLLRDGLNT